jgi:branched-chain amino acid aminotransferase
VCTPPVTAGILEGITRDTVITIARDQGLPVQERNISRGELYTCDEAFFAGTAAEITPILSIDKRTVGEGAHAGPITQRLQELFSKVVSGQDCKYRHWLTPVYPQNIEVSKVA